MPKLPLTEKAIIKLAAPTPSRKQVVYWDTDLKGFGVLCSGVKASKTYIVQRDLPGGGPTRRATVGPCNTLTLVEAKAQAVGQLNAMRAGQDPKHKPVAAPTLRTALAAYLLARKDLRPASARVYRQIERTLAPWLDWQLNQITGPLVEARHREIAAGITGNATKYVGRSTANGAMRTLSIVWNYAALRTPDLPANPVKWLSRGWYPEPRRKRNVTLDQLPAFYNAVRALKNPVARDYFLLLLFTGFRKLEAASLRWQDIDLGQRVIHLAAPHTKSGVDLDLPMSDVVHDLFVARRALGVDKFVFPGNGASGHLTDTSSHLAKVATTCGVLISAHDLRRTFLSVAEKTPGVSYLELKMMVNHSVGNDVTAGYIEVDLREAVQRVADRMKTLCGLTPVAGGNVTRLRSSTRRK